MQNMPSNLTLDTEERIVAYVLLVFQDWFMLESSQIHIPAGADPENKMWGGQNIF